MIHLLHRVMVLIDGESVRHYQTAVYIAYFAAGFQMLVFGSLPSAVALTLGDGFNVAWAMLLVGAPTLMFAGRALKHSIAGLWLQLGGDTGVLFASLTYVTALFQAGFGRRATYTEWVVGSLVVCAFTMTVRDVRKLRVASRLVKDTLR